MLAEKLQVYYGGYDDETGIFIQEKERDYDGEEVEKIYEWVITNRSQKFGFPDIAFMFRAFNAVKPTSQRKHIWCVCNQCKSEYSYMLPYCPKCWNDGLLCRSYSVKASTEPPPMSVIRYNIQYTYGAEQENIGDKKICYNCPTAKSGLSFCKDFGKSSVFCKNYRECPCNSCCSKAKIERERFNKQLQTKSAQYAVPLKTFDVNGNAVTKV